MAIYPDNPNERLALHMLRDCIGSMRYKYAMFFLVIIIGALVGLMPPQLYRLFFQSIDNNGAGVIEKLLVFGIIIALCTMVATALSIYAREWLRCEIEATLRKKVLFALSITSLQQLESVNRGEWIACTSGDLIDTEEFLTLSFPDQIKNLLMFIGSTSLFLYYGGLFGAILLALGIGLIFLNISIQKKLRPALNEIRSLHGDVYQQLLENFEGLRTIRSFGGEELVQNNFAQKLQVINRKSLSTMRHFATLIGTNELFILLGMTSVLALILFRLQQQTLTFDDALIYPFYMGIFFSSVASFYRSNFDWSMFFTKGARLATLIYGLGNKRTGVYDSVAYASYDESTTKLAFSALELKYEGHKPLAPLFGLTIKKHEILGVIGPSGSGKSTLLEFLAGLRPLTVNGRKELLPTSLTSYVEQKPYIFEGSLADNLRFGCNSMVSDDQIWAALEKSHLAYFFRKKSGLDFQILERGQNLSEGEKYRIGITRAILSNKPFLLIDEPFAALDHVSIRAIVELIKNERANRGIVVVTHYLPPELVFDRVLDFEQLAKPLTSFSSARESTAPKLVEPRTLLNGFVS